MADRYRVKSPPVVAETLDGEATIVDLASGTYFALNESGTYIWDRLASGAPADRVAAGLAERYGLEAEQATTAVGELVSELTARELIVSADGDGAARASAAAPTSVSAQGSAAPAPANGSGPEPAPPLAPYAEPELTAFTDMQELLLLDPVHEVDEAGWPELK